jgi:hypothetical protein
MILRRIAPPDIDLAGEIRMKLVDGGRQDRLFVPGGSEKMPEPTMDPITIAVSAKSESFWVAGVALMRGPRAEGGVLAGRFVRSRTVRLARGPGISGDYLVVAEDSPSRLCPRTCHGISGKKAA